MIQKLVMIILMMFFTSYNAFAQDETQFAIALLENDDIATVNIDQNDFIKSIAGVIDVLKNEFKDIEESQKFAILLTAHKEGEPTIEFYAHPEIDGKQKEQFLNTLKSQDIQNTKLVDFPILILTNSRLADCKEDFKDLLLPTDKRDKEYHNANLRKQYALNIAYANEVLTVLNAYQVMVDDQFVGVKAFGQLVSKTHFKNKQNLRKLTSENSDYWRATMEMSVGNQLIPVTKIFMLASQGEFDYAQKYIDVIQFYSNPETVSNRYISELAERLAQFNRQLKEKIQEGIAHHDKGDYASAIAVYDKILKDYPNSAWAKYEAYLSQNALSIANKDTGFDDKLAWDNAKLGVYKSNPLYPMNVRASNGKEAYLLFKRASISELFKNTDHVLGDTYKYADIAMDLEVYDFAAQLFWLSVSFDEADNDAHYKFLYCLKKLGVSDLQDSFKGDFEKEFKKIEADKKEEMLKSGIYQIFEN